MPSRKCGICVSQQRVAIEKDRLVGLSFKELADKYPFTVRQLQYHLDKHWNKPRPEASADELQKRLDSLVERCETLVKNADADNASFGQKTKALGTLNTVLKTALQVSGMLKSLAPPVQAGHDFSQSHEYRVLVARINESCVCPDCRKKLLEAFNAGG